MRRVIAKSAAACAPVKAAAAPPPGVGSLLARRLRYSSTVTFPNTAILSFGALVVVLVEPKCIAQGHGHGHRSYPRNKDSGFLGDVVGKVPQRREIDAEG